MKPRRRSFCAHKLGSLLVTCLLAACAGTPRAKDDGNTARASETSATAPPAEPVTTDGARSASASGASSGSEAPSEAASKARIVELPVEGFRSAFVALPADAAKPFPAVVAAHGAGDGPRYQCEFWRQLLNERAIVLCPTGVPLGRSEEAGHYYRDHRELEREVLAAVAALRATYAERVAEGPLVYVAYSQGATMGSLMLPPHGDLFQSLILIEGGYEQWNVPIAKRFREAGGRRVLFACGTQSCARGAERSSEWMTQAGLEAHVEYAPRGGHTYGGAVGERVARSLGWLLSGDERFR